MEREGFYPDRAEPQPAQELVAPSPGEVETLESVDADNRQATEEVERPASPEPLSFEKLPEAQQYQIIDQLLEGMREAIGPVREHAVFASTAMYLNGEKIVAGGDEAGRELMKPPGDFDAAVFKLEDIDAIRDRLRRMPDVIFANAKKDENNQIRRDASGQVVYDGKPGDYGRFPGQDTKILAGQRVFNVELDGKTEKVAYEFEIFLNSKMVPRSAARDLATDSHGLRILNLDGLADQYKRNLGYELRVNDSVNKVIKDLRSDSPEARNFKAEIMSLELGVTGEGGDIEGDENMALTQETLTHLQNLEIGPKAMKRVFEIQAKLDATEAELKVPFTKLNEEGVFEQYTQALIESGNEDKANTVFEVYKDVQKLVSERATLLAGTKTKLWKRDLNLLQLAKLRAGKS